MTLKISDNISPLLVLWRAWWDLKQKCSPKQVHNIGLNKKPPRPVSLSGIYMNIEEYQSLLSS